MQYKLRQLTAPQALQLPCVLSALPEEEPVTFWVQPDSADPLGCLFTARTIERFCRQHPKRSICVQTSANSIASEALDMDFWTALLEGTDGEIPLTELHFDALHRQALREEERPLALGDAIERASARLVAPCSGGTAAEQALLTYTLREMLRNVPEHARCDTAWIAGRRQGHQVALAVVDEGMGIRRSLWSNPAHRQTIETEEDALRWAVKAGISRAFHPARRNPSQDPWANSGFGLYMLQALCQVQGGSFCLASGSRSLWMEQDGTLRTGETQWQGTALQVTLSLEHLTDVPALLGQLAGQGERQAKRIRNAFRKASRPSRMLMDL